VRNGCAKSAGSETGTLFSLDRGMSNKLVCLPVRTVRVVSRVAETREETYVSCPIRGATVVPQCECCERLEMITADDRGHPDAVMCRPPLSLWARLLERTRTLPRSPVHALVTRGLTCATCDASPQQLADIMIDGRVDAVPIVDYERCALGVVTRTDLMMQRAVTIEQHETIARAVELMLIEGALHLVVTDAGGHVVGLLSARDVARQMVRLLEQPIVSGRAA
jgi:CBS domain-containing protein